MIAQIYLQGSNTPVRVADVKNHPKLVHLFVSRDNFDNGHHVAHFEVDEHDWEELSKIYKLVGIPFLVVFSPSPEYYLYY